MQTMQPGHGSRILTDADNLLITHSDILKFLEGDGCVVVNKRRRGLRHLLYISQKSVIDIFSQFPDVNGDVGGTGQVSPVNKRRVFSEKM